MARPIRSRLASLAALVALVLAPVLAAEPAQGYYRMPAIHGDTLVFVAEGDLWRVPVAGGRATRLTSHPGTESHPAISPDGTSVAFSASYEGPTEVYAMPLAGGLPVRLTWDFDRATVVGFTPQGRVIFSSAARSTLPAARLFTVDPATGCIEAVPLAQAADGSYDDAGRTLYFTRLAFQGSHTKRYRGGTAQNIWSFAPGDAEARSLTADYVGTSKEPMWWRDRVYFASDRDGATNLWSMKPDGTDLRQHTRHTAFDVASPSLHDGRIAYQLAADLYVYDVAADTTRAVGITLDSDFDQTREHWVEKPIDYVTSAHVSPTGDRVALTARGQVFVAPARQGRFVQATRGTGVRYRDARFLPDGESLVVLADETGEIELWKLPANGVGQPEALTRDGEVLRWETVPSPDGRYIAHHDKNQRLWLYDVEQKTNRKIDESAVDGFADLAWSPDGAWLAYVATADNLLRQIRLYRVADGTRALATTDRHDSFNPAWSPDGAWLYFLSDRNLDSVVRSPWGTFQPEPLFDRRTKIYQLALRAGVRSPFAPADELHPADDAKKEPDPGDDAKSKKKEKDKQTKSVVTIDVDGLAARLLEVPVPAGNYAGLIVTADALFWLSSDTGVDAKTHLVGAAISRESVEVKQLLADVRSVEPSQDGKKLLVRQGDRLHLVDAAPKPVDPEKDKTAVDLSAFTLAVSPRDEWRQMFLEAWRLERDYFYDLEMHGVDWRAMRARYLPLVDRVRSREELSDLIAQMVSELSALHIFVYGGEVRKGDDEVTVASLGAVLERDEAAGGFRVAHIYRSDPDEPQRTAPLARPEVGVAEGDVIESIDGARLLDVADPAVLLRHKAGRQVLLRVSARGVAKAARDAIVVPISADAAADLRYHEWEYTRRLETERLGEGRIGYLHLRAMGGRDFSDFARGFYPAFTREGLIIDVRNNRGGNIDSWILGRLLRKAWFYWTQRVGRSPTWNMQYAFRGHIAVLCNERTASDGEAFAAGIQRLGLGKVIGTRTWGGEIWLSSSNFLVDGGIATAAEFGVFGPEGEWLIEGHGVDPDLVVDNPPHATFGGRDAQLEAAIGYLAQRIAEEPVQLPPVPPHPDKTRP